MKLTILSLFLTLSIVAMGTVANANVSGAENAPAANAGEGHSMGSDMAHPQAQGGTVTGHEAPSGYPENTKPPVDSSHQPSSN